MDLLQPSKGKHSVNFLFILTCIVLLNAATFTNQTHQTPVATSRVLSSKNVWTVDLFSSYPPAAPNDQMALTHWPSSSFHQPPNQIAYLNCCSSFLKPCFFESQFAGVVVGSNLSPPIQIGTIPQFRMLRACGVFIELQKQLSSDAHFIRIKEEPRAQTDSQRFDKTRNHLEQITDHHPGAVSFSCHKGITRQPHGKEQNPCKKKVACNMSLRPTKCWVCLTWRVAGWGWGQSSHSQGFHTKQPPSLRPWPHGQLQVWIGKRQSGEWPGSRIGFCRFGHAG